MDLRNKPEKRADEQSKDLDRMSVDAAAKFLERRGYRLIGSHLDGPVQIVATDPDDRSTVLVMVAARDGGERPLPPDPFTQMGEDGMRRAFESAMLDLAADGTIRDDGRIRLDTVLLSVFDGERAIVWHSVGAL